MSDTMRDTSIIVRTFEKFDSIYLTKPNDTITIDNTKVWTRIIREHDTLRIEQQVKPDTSYIYRERVVIKYKTKQSRWYRWLILVAVVLFWVYVIKHIYGQRISTHDKSSD